MLTAASMSDSDQCNIDLPLPTNLHDLFLAIRDRHSSNPIDKVCAIAFPFQKRGNGDFHVTFPIYDPSTPVSVAWRGLISSIASTEMDVSDFMANQGQDIFSRTTTVQLLCLFPHPSRHHWFPSWTQVLQYPDVSIRDNDPIPVAEDMDYSLRIVYGRIYRDCSLKIKRCHTSKEKASYHCSMGMGSKIVELVATVPGVELDIDSRRGYVLVDISPDYSLLNVNPRRRKGEQGHVHPPIWERSVIIVCEEVDNLAHAQPVQVTTNSPAQGILRYRLRRVTTLYWDTHEWGNVWLPFEPSLEHIRFVVCDGPIPVTSLFPQDTFCNSAATRDLVKKAMYGWDKCQGEWDKCPVYKVYLV